MNKLRLIFSLCLLSVLSLGTVGIANAQGMTNAVNSLVPQIDVYCDGDYPTASFTLPADFSSENPANPEYCIQINLDVSVPSDVVDWILLELRGVDHGGSPGDTNVNNAGASTLVARKPAFLLQNGRIVDAESYAAQIDNDSTATCDESDVAAADQTNCPDLQFSDISAAIDGKDLYLVMRHRNHLDIISNTHLSELTGNAGVYAYDFSTGSSQARGGSLALKAKSSTYAMYGGDTDADGTVLASDYSSEVQGRFGEGGYRYGDADMNGTVTAGDYSSIVAGNLNRGTQTP